MLMCYGEYENVVNILCVHHAVGETLESAAADLGCEWVPRGWKLLNQFDGLQRFDQKRITQSRRLLRIPGNRLVKLCLCGLKQANVHAGFALTWYLAITSDNATARTSPRR